VTICLLLLSNVSFSQQRKILGRIVNMETQKPIKNANVVIHGTTSRTITNYLGFFELTIDPPKHKTLVVSHIGFKTCEIIIPAEDHFKFMMEKEYVVLNELDVSLYPKDLIDEVEGHKMPDGARFENESAATFPGGINNFYNLLGNSLKSDLPERYEKSFEVKFTVNETGQSADISVSDSSEFARSAVIEAFQKMPDWLPATQLENKVPHHFILRINPLPYPDASSLDLNDLYTFISRNIRYPLQARTMGVEGGVFAKFELDYLGNVAGIEILADIGGDCGDEVRRIINTTPIELRKSLVDKTHFNKFILPVCFGLDKKYKSETFIPESGVVLLNDIAVVIIGVTRDEHALYYSPLSENRAVLAARAIDEKYHDLGKALKQPKSIKRFSLIRENLSSFPSDILKFVNLEFLDLENNQIQTLPPEIELLTELQELYLFRNKVETLPSNFGNLKKMKVLGIAANQMKLFPMAITSLDKLEILDLSDNQLSTIPAEIAAMRNLRILVLHNNNLTKIPQELYQLKKLEKIYLQFNPIDPKDIELLKVVLKKTEIIF
jgi:hypothetical protein